MPEGPRPPGTNGTADVYAPIHRAAHAPTNVRRWYDAPSNAQKTGNGDINGGVGRNVDGNVDTNGDGDTKVDAGAQAGTEGEGSEDEVGRVDVGRVAVGRVHVDVGIGRVDVGRVGRVEGSDGGTPLRSRVVWPDLTGRPDGMHGANGCLGSMLSTCGMQAAVTCDALARCPWRHGRAVRYELTTAATIGAAPAADSAVVRLICTIVRLRVLHAAACAREGGRGRTLEAVIWTGVRGERNEGMRCRVCTSGSMTCGSSRSVTRFEDGVRLRCLRRAHESMAPSTASSTAPRCMPAVSSLTASNLG